MYVITYKGRPAHLRILYRVNRRLYQEGDIAENYITGSTETEAKSRYIYHFGYTWKERIQFVAAERVVKTVNDTLSRNALRSSPYKKGSRNIVESRAYKTRNNKRGELPF